MKNIERNLVLIGMRGTGKTAIGKTLAEFLKFQFVDIDTEIEKNENAKIAEIVAKKDWEYFRSLEATETKKFAATKNCVISTGGGVVLRPRNIENLKKNGIVIFIHAPLPHLARRVAKNTNRPSLTGASPTDELAKIWADREKFYRAAADVEVFFDFETKNKKTDLLRKSKLILQAVKKFR
ncbi:shikimate kinase [Candidatus Gracilibacteria bacterium]|nr:shikimate kinase [Candidatus Gracilibacteria bacterium]MCF7856265.1 shikimate kinase [Candidatus Gracilibacteria bacterium]MCF7896256.1 shikimate kinase [Candidatus Gracilibacteria bacterium]